MTPMRLWTAPDDYISNSLTPPMPRATRNGIVSNSQPKCLGFGRYQFQVIGRIDQLDPNVVLGLFKYPTPDVGPDGTNEIDIEFAQWGRATANNAD